MFFFCTLFQRSFFLQSTKTFVGISTANSDWLCVAHRLVVSVATAAIAGCASPPPPLSVAHLAAPALDVVDTAIPPLATRVPPLPEPGNTPPVDTYRVSVNQVRAQDLLFALARDAQLNIDIHPGISGQVTLNAIDQTLPQLLKRIARQVPMRYELSASSLYVAPDTPYIQTYRVDYLNQQRESRAQIALSTQVAGAGASSGGGSSTLAGGTNSTTAILSQSNHRFWDTLIANIKALIQDSPAITTQNKRETSAAPNANNTAGVNRESAATETNNGEEFRDEHNVIANPEAGVISIRATAKQHATIQAFLDQALANVKRQVLIEATIVEVALNNQYQQGIDWSRTLGGSTGFRATQSSLNTPATINTNAFVVGYSAEKFNLSGTLRLLESFGQVKVLSSPKISVLNNHTATLRVASNLVYFEVVANAVASANVAVTTTFSTTARTIPVGFLMHVVPQISDTDNVLLSVRPTISRFVRYVPDPNPSLGVTQNLVPETQTREMESLLRIQSGHTAVLGGLIQDDVSRTEDFIPGLRQVPGLGALFQQRRDTATKTELVIFLRPTVLHDAHVLGDFKPLREFLPTRQIPQDNDRATSSLVQAPSPNSAVMISKAPAQMDVASSSLTSAWQAYQAQDFVAARQHYRAALQAHPGQRDAWLGIAAIEMRETHPLASLQAYREVLQRDPDDVAALMGVIALNPSSQTPSQIESELRTLIAQKESTPALHFSLANQLALQGRWADAKMHYTIASDADPFQPDYVYNLAVCLDHLHQLSSALTFYQRALMLAKGRAAHFPLAILEKRIDALKS